MTMTSVKNQNVSLKEEIFHSILANNLENLKKLVNSDNVNLKDRSGYTLLHVATNNEKTEIAKWLVNIGADINLHCNSHTVLSTALNKGNYELFDFYLENKAECIGRNQLNVLHEAANKDRLDIVERLMEKGADPNLFNNSHITPLTIAINRRNKKIIMLLLENGACANLPDKKGNTSLHLACSLNDSELINCLLDNTECDLKLKNLNEETCFDLLFISMLKDTSKQLDEELIKKMIKLGASLSLPWNFNLNNENYKIFLKLISLLCKYINRLSDLFLLDKPFFVDLILNGYWKNSVIIAIKYGIMWLMQENSSKCFNQALKSDFLKPIEIILLSNEFNLDKNHFLSTLSLLENDTETEEKMIVDNEQEQHVELDFNINNVTNLSELFKFLRNFFLKPSSLKNLCRVQLRKSFNAQVLNTFASNDKKVFDFLNFVDYSNKPLN